MIDDNKFKEILNKQYEIYPKMQIQDMVKFIYQNEFAGGHLIENEKKSLIMLEKETQKIRSKDSEKMLNVRFEKIGNNLSRIHFSDYDSDEGLNNSLDLSTINKFFVNTANSVIGDWDKFESKLAIFKECCKNNCFLYSIDEVDFYLEDYKKKGYPLVSHSKEYKKLYSPSYRIVKDEYRHFFSIFKKITTLKKSKEHIRIAIEGNSGSGKTSLARMIEGIYDCNVFHMDDYFLRPEQRTSERLKEVAGNIDYERFYQDVILGLNNKKIQYQPYNCKTEKLKEPIHIQYKSISIIEGVYSMHPMFLESYDLTIFLYLNKDQQSERILKRNGSIMHERFVKEWIPMENKYFDKKSIMNTSDLVFKGYIPTN